MSRTRLFALLAVGSGAVFLGAVVVINASCHGDFECGGAANGAWAVMTLSATAAFIFLVLASISAVRRSR
jgi:hypothetical protein